MKPHVKTMLLLAMAAVLLVGSGFFQRGLNQDRDKLGLTRIAPLENAPPVLAFTTVALGGFRGLISNALWIRATDLQDEDKYFEMAQLADWITKLEPHFVQVWLVQSWNMAYNISVKFKDFDDRWRWVRRGIVLLRDDGLRFNPNETLIYRELAWFFQHKMGANLDDAHLVYKQEWANEMAKVFAKQTPNLDELINPRTDDQKERAKLLRETYKMDPAFMKVVDERYGPLEWRLPEAHAIYWAAMGLRKAEENPERIKPEDLITLRRVIYQSMLLSFQRGKLIPNPFSKQFEFGPNLAIIPKVSAAYEQAAEEDKNNTEHILRAHRNFLRDAVYFLYSHNRVPDAAKWYRYLGEKYPNGTLIEGDTNSVPRNVTLDRYVFNRVQVDVNETDVNRVRSSLEGLLINSYMSMAIDEDERSAGFKLLARQIHTTFQSEVKASGDRVSLPPLESIDAEIRRRLLDPNEGMPVEMRAALRARMGLPVEAEPPPAAPGTNAPPTARSS